MRISIIGAGNLEMIQKYSKTSKKKLEKLMFLQSSALARELMSRFLRLRIS
jgi:hypothetical protein